MRIAIETISVKSLLLSATTVFAALTGAFWASAQTPDMTYDADRVMFAAKRANVRSGPGTGYSKSDLLEVGERVVVTAKTGDWFKLAPRLGQAQRFVFAPLLTAIAPQAAKNWPRGQISSKGTPRYGSGVSEGDIDRASQAVWKLYGVTGRKIYKIGTAFAVGQREFITAAHTIKVLIEINPEHILLSLGTVAIEFDALKSISLTYDIAYFTTKQRVVHYLDLDNGDFDPYQEDSLFLVGYHLEAVTPQVARQAGAISPNDNYLYRTPFKPRTEKGQSGSPVIGSDGDVVAVHISRYGSESHGAKSKHIFALLDGSIGVTCWSGLDRRCLTDASDKVLDMSAAGNPIAQYQVGTGRRYVRSKIDLELLTRSARGGFFRAQQILCSIYFHGRDGIPKDRGKARYWCGRVR